MGALKVFYLLLVLQKRAPYAAPQVTTNSIQVLNLQVLHLPPQVPLLLFFVCELMVSCLNAVNELQNSLYGLETKDCVLIATAD